MSEQANTAVTPATTETAAETAAKTLEKLQTRFTKYGKLIARASDNLALSAISALVDQFSVSRDERGAVVNGSDGKPLANPKYFDWTGKAPEGFDSYALVRCEETDKDGEAVGEHFGDIRLISIANWTLASASAVVIDWLYRAYQNKVVLKADKDDAQEADFIVPDGAFKMALSDEAFDAVAKPMLKMMHIQGLTGINKAGLKQSFGNAAFAEASYPRVKPEIWANLINLGKTFAASKGLDTAIFDYWLSTRDARDDKGGIIELDLSAFATGLGVAPTAASTTGAAQA